MKFNKTVSKIIREQWFSPGLAPPITGLMPPPEGAGEALWIAVQIADPTIITSIPDLINAAIKYNSEPSEENLVVLLVCILFIIPVFETIKLVKLVKKEDGVKMLANKIIENKNKILSTIRKNAPYLEQIVNDAISRLNK